MLLQYSWTWSGDHNINIDYNTKQCGYTVSKSRLVLQKGNVNYIVITSRIKDKEDITIFPACLARISG